MMSGNSTQKQENHPMPKAYRKALTQASPKPNPSRDDLRCLALALPLHDLFNGVRADLEALSAQAGLALMKLVMNDEITQQLGDWGQQRVHRYGQQNGYVVFHGRKTPLTRPRARRADGTEVALKTYRAFQQDGPRQSAVARLLVRHCSTRNYAGALEECLEGYGIARSSVSREFQLVSAARLKQLCERRVPQDLVALMLDGQQFADECILVALGIDKEGRKHILGLWQGSSENATVVRALLKDLIERGLDVNRRTLVVIDGGKGLHCGVKEVFGERALIQRCRVHKMRNVLEHLREPYRRQAQMRLRAAWSQPTVSEARAALEAIVRWLEGINPSAARSLQEGLEETLTLQQLGIAEELQRSLSSTNLIESALARTGAFTQRVKRWCATALLEAEKGFRRIRGYQHLAALSAALNRPTLDIAAQAA